MIQEASAESSDVTKQDSVKQVPGKGAAFMNRIDVEISAPLAGTSEYVREDIPNVFDEPSVPIRPVRIEAEELEPEIPACMPELKRNAPISSVQKVTEEKPVLKKPVEENTGKVTPKDTAESAQQVRRLEVKAVGN